MQHYREATLQDAESIAILHATSWRNTYRGMFSDSFLDTEVWKDRKNVWEQRFFSPIPNQKVIVAEENGSLSGFVCAFGDEDSVWGTLIDNLHVSRQKQGQGIGAQLLKQIVFWMQHSHLSDSFYLWVLNDNHPARRFYEKLGAINQEAVLHDNPGGGQSLALRYAWPDYRILLNKIS
ncbi:GNAT family N-acetyltransferase [Cytophagaceae bacterium YF14B1]|uniref:GNAT family N-acetyltransferase n=1 Tax=Xanthocytophaga flava TaxID=3048013 RepID=A0AAE3QHM2_9BACT|nr:GNAT family N-acetyltransferase [Xanthocytophaga flavus]MDJ1478980.1 GNAT family N-acetyltransferase [Xanthocytophaga flavus]